jgi:hypothetical protein
MGGNCGNVALQKLMDIYVPVLFYFLGCIFAQARHMVHEEWIDHQLQAVQDQKCQDCNLALCAGWAIASMSRSAPDVCSAVQGRAIDGQWWLCGRNCKRTMANLSAGVHFGLECERGAFDNGSVNSCICVCWPERQIHVRDRFTTIIMS